MPERTRTHVIVKGMVQGVFFRAETRETALTLGLDGWVRNMPDGTVEAVFEGEPSMVESAVEWCRHGPSYARVDSIEVQKEEPAGEKGFSVRYR